MSRAKRIGTHLILPSLDILGALLLGEVLLRCFFPSYAHETERDLPWVHPFSTLEYTVDADFGFRPILGESGSIYGKYGTVNQHALEKKAGVTRLIFLGDSVTFRRKIIDALQRIYGESQFEYWNAGVKAFNALQEVNFYKKHNASINPDRVILTFHLNDFETTPIAFVDSESKFVVYAPNRPLKEISPWFFKNSYLNRFALRLGSGRSKDKEAIAREIRLCLGELKDLLDKDDISLTVLVHPILDQYWSPQELAARTDILAILKSLNLRYFDLLNPLKAAILNGIDLQQNPGDRWHPSDEISTTFAEYLHKNHLLTPQ